VDGISGLKNNNGQKHQEEGVGVEVGILVLEPWNKIPHNTINYTKNN
jgi:hypothetical protein